MAYRHLVALLMLLVLGIAVLARAEEVGEVVQTRKALKILTSGSLPLEDKEPVQAGLIVSLIPQDSFVVFKLTVAGFIPQPEASTVTVRCSKDSNDECFFSKGPDSEITIEEARRKEGTGIIQLGLKLDRGTLWMALGQMVLHQVWILTPQLKARPRGTSFRMLVDPIVGTFLATDEGMVKVEVPAGGEEFSVTAHHWLLVPPRGTIQRGANDRAPRDLDDPPLIDCCDFRTGPP